MGERLRCQLPTRVELEAARPPELGKDAFVPGELAHRRDVDEVLRGRAEHGGTADVDHLDSLLLAHVSLGRYALERVEVDADEVERPDVVLAKHLQVLRNVTAGQDGGVNARVKRLHPAAEHLRDVGELLDASDGDTEVRDERRRAPARDDLDVELMEASCELVEARLVED